MKAIAFNRHPAQPFTKPLSVTMFADSAITPCLRPVFLPDFSDKWIARILPACRISRLGKSIETRFAPRYFDAVTLCLHLMPQQWYEQLTCGELHGDLPGLFDNALITGQWIEPQPGKPLEIKINALDTTIAWDAVGFEKAISETSQFATLKNGDILMPCALQVEIPAYEGFYFKGSLDSQSVINFKLK